MAGLVYANLIARTLVYTNLRNGPTTPAPGRAARTEESSGGTAALANRRSPKPIDPQDLSSMSERHGSCDDMLLTAATVIAQDQPLQPGWIQIDGGRVTAVGAGSPPRAGESGDLDLGDRIVVPGFVTCTSTAAAVPSRPETPIRPGPRSTCLAATAPRRALPHWSPRVPPTCCGSSV